MAGLLLAAPGAADAEVAWDGEIRTELGAKLRSCPSAGCELLDYRNLNRLWLGGRLSLGDRVASRFKLEVRNRSSPTHKSADDLGDADRVQPIDIRLRQAWVEAYDALWQDSGIDVRIGAQRIVWGVGDGWSPTDRINPFDLEDPTRFDRRLAVPAALATWHLGESVTLSGVWLPVFTPAVLPTDHFRLTDVADADDIIDLEPHIGGDAPDIGDITTVIDRPPRTLVDGGSGAIRLAWQAPEPFGDLAIGWLHGRDPVPQISGEVVPISLRAANDPDAPRVADLTVHLRHPRFDMLAFEYRGPFPAPYLADHVSIWADVAQIFPSRTHAFISKSRLDDLERVGAIDSAPDEDVTGQVQDGEPYTQALAGLDTELGDLYLNLQWFHGFLIERPPQELHDYAVLALRYPAVGGVVRFHMRSALELGDAQDDELGWFTSARLSHRFADHLESALVVVWQDGRGGTTFRRFRNLSEARVEVGARF